MTGERTGGEKARGGEKKGGEGAEGGSMDS